MNISKIFNIYGFSQIIGQIFRFLDYLWPKQKNLIIFSSMHGQGFADNSRYLFEKFLRHYSSIVDSVWVSSDRDVVKKIQMNCGKDKAVYLYSINGIKIILSSKVAFSSYLTDYFPGIRFSKKTIFFHLGHGVPIKAIVGEDKHYSARKRNMLKNEVKKRYTYWISSSTMDRNMISLCTGLDSDKILISGLPRNDSFSPESISELNLETKYPFLNNKIILYAPTWRPGEPVEFFPFEDLDIDRLNHYLERHNAYLILRGHLADDILKWNGSINFDGKTGSRIVKMNRDSIYEIQELLPYVDILITDYSSIWVDYLLFNRPIIFVPYDLEKYLSDPGLLYDFEAITPGLKVHDFAGFIRALDIYLKDPSIHSMERDFIKSVFHKYSDFRAYERIFKFIGDFIK